jgi:hypothetical protein
VLATLAVLAQISAPSAAHFLKSHQLLSAKVAADRDRQKGPFDEGRHDGIGRWLSLAHSYEFAEGLANYVEPFRKPNRKRPSE